MEILQVVKVHVLRSRLRVSIHAVDLVSIGSTHMPLIKTFILILSFVNSIIVNQR